MAKSWRSVGAARNLASTLLAIAVTVACSGPVPSGAGGDPPAGGPPIVDPPTIDPPTIDTFTADEATIATGDGTTLRWTVTNADAITLDDGTNDLPLTEGATSLDITPSSTSTYTLTASNTGGTTDASVNVTVEPPVGDVEPPAAVTLTDLTALVVRGSRVALAWSVVNAVAVDVFAVAVDDADDIESIASELPGETERLTVPIPASARQIIRVVARGAGGEQATESLEVVLENVVTAEGDYRARYGELPIPGSLRDVLERAEPGAVIGFAADVRVVDLVGIDADADQRAHLILGATRIPGDLTISGPAWDGAEASPVTLRGAPGLPFVERSRLIFVAAGADVTIENLRLTGGALTYSGGAIRNDGTLAIERSVIEGNRAFSWGGGIHNQGGQLTISDSVVRDNVSAVLEVEEGELREIDGDSHYVFCVPEPGGWCWELIVSTGGGAGGGLQNIGGVVSIAGSRFVGNHAKYSGGGLCNYGGHMAIVETDFDYNSATSAPYPGFDFPNRGGGVYSTRFGSMTMHGGRLHGNSVDDAEGWGGGASLRYSATLEMVGVTITGNSAQLGGGIFLETAVGEPVNYALSGLSFADNVSAEGDNDRFEWSTQP